MTRTSILIADDNEVARGLLRDTLASRADWVVCGEATNGLEAVRQALELKPDLIVMDMAMPEMDGLQASQEILKSLPGLPIILHTMHTGEQVTIVAKQMGIQSVVAKTAPVGELESVIEESLLRRAESLAASPGNSVSDATAASGAKVLEAAAGSSQSAQTASVSDPSDPPKSN
ncbi:MAG TPA: response regulator transcription factor [Candidatus Acidoferrales bacterium]|nr:response regulator transcription factor [Candidatus Acidoferrales bacterium]